MSGFFGTFVMFVIAMAWAQWLVVRVPWATRVVYAGVAVYLLSLLYAVVAFGRSGGQSEALGNALGQVWLAAQIAQTAALVTLAGMGLVTIYALTRTADGGSS